MKKKRATLFMVGLYLGGVKTVYLLPSHEGIIFKKNIVCKDPY